MKHILKPTLFLAGALLSTSSFLSAGAVPPASVATDPVGYVTLNSTNGDDVRVYPQLLRESVLTGSPSDVTGGVLTIGSGLTVNEFAINAHIVLFCSGNLAGEWFQVTENTATSVSVTSALDPVDLVAMGATANDSIKVIPTWTLGTLFPGGQGIVASSDFQNPEAFILVNNPNATGTNLSTGNAYFYYNGGVLPAGEGWYLDGSFSSTVNDTPISPDTYFTVRSSGGDASVVVSGGVPVDQLATHVGRIIDGVAQDNQLVNPYPSAMTLGESELFESGAVQGSPDFQNPVDFVLVYENTDGAGTNTAASKSYFYYTGGVLPAGSGWYLDGQFSATVNDDVIPAGGAFIVRKAAGSSGTVKWSPPVPYASSL